MHTRVAKTVESPVTANVLALESREGDKSLDQAIMVCCDLVVIREDVEPRIRKRVASNARKLLINATHTHTAPVMVEGKYLIPKDGVMQPAKYVEFLTEQVSNAVAKAWKSRKPAGQVPPPVETSRNFAASIGRSNQCVWAAASESR
jgi:hypothetical protein